MNSGEDLFWDTSQHADNSNEFAQPSKSAKIQKSNSAQKKIISSDKKSEKTHENDGNQVAKSAQSLLSYSKSI